MEEVPLEILMLSACISVPCKILTSILFSVDNENDWIFAFRLEIKIHACAQFFFFFFFFFRKRQWLLSVSDDCQRRPFRTVDQEYDEYVVSSA